MSAFQPHGGSVVSLSRLFVFLAALVVASSLSLAQAAPAAAHDELLSSTPASGERWDAAPEEVSLQFAADVLTIGAAVIVADGAGRDWVVGEPIVDAGSVRVELAADMPEAGYEIRWRVVSEDGHPISGVIPFTVGDGAPLVRETPEVGSESASATPVAPQDSGTVRLILIGIAGAVIAAGYALIHTLRRRRALRAGDRDAPAA